MPRFEAHITYPLDAAREVEAAAEPAAWVYSQISGCPLLGQGTYCYLTGYNTDADALLKDMERVAATVVAQPLRMKIERIVFDTKTGVNELKPQPPYRTSSIETRASDATWRGGY